MQNAPSSILIVDHEQGARSDLADCLMERGYTVATTSPGDEARSLLGRQRFDILLAEVGPDANRALALVDAGLHEAFGEARVALQAFLAQLQGLLLSLCQKLAGLVLLLEGDHDLFDFELFAHPNNGDDGLISENGIGNWVYAIQRS